MPAPCGTLLRDGSVCTRPVGHSGECEEYSGKRKRPIEVVEALKDARTHAYRPQARVGDDYQAIVPPWLSANDTTLPGPEYDRKDQLISRVCVCDCVSCRQRELQCVCDVCAPGAR